MTPITDRQAKILALLRQTPGGMSSTRLREHFPEVALVTIKRDIAALVRTGSVQSSGKGRSAGYQIAVQGKFFTPIDAHEYVAQEPDLRGGYERYDHTLFTSFPYKLFPATEKEILDASTAIFRDRSAKISDTLAQKELERFVIELSWKSSRIEGNTYTLLDTERLIREGIEAPDHSHEEAIMILNHKEAFEFVRAHLREFAGVPSQAAIEELHRILVRDLRVNRGFRSHVVGITGTRYRPLENKFQIQEAMFSLRETIGRARDPYSAALTALLGISYIQPFEDGNKRTARLLGNAILLAGNCAPLSYRSVDEVAYREATLVFYETHSVVPLKDLFETQYLFAADQYGIR